LLNLWGSSDLYSLPEFEPPKAQDSNYIVFGLSPTTQKARIYTVALTLYPIMDATNTLIPSEKFKTAPRSVYDVEPYPWQAQFGGSIIIKSVLTNWPKVNLLVAPTGGSKSLVRDVCGLCFGGVNLTIVPLLSLGTDQASKGFQKPHQDQGVVTAFHLDEIRDDCRGVDQQTSSFTPYASSHHDKNYLPIFVAATNCVEYINGKSHI
jgi:hypothetical protein